MNTLKISGISTIFVACLAIGGLFLSSHNVTKPSVGAGFNLSTTYPVSASSTVGVVSTLIAASSSARGFLVISNDSANTVYVSFGNPAVLGKGIRIASGTNYTFNSLNNFSAPVFGISTASSNVATFESNN